MSETLKFGNGVAPAFRNGQLLFARTNRAQWAAIMFGSLKTLIASLVGEGGPPHRPEAGNCRLATAALLMRVAAVDGEMSEARLEKLRAVLKSNFELDDLATTRLIDAAAAADQSAI